MTSLRNTLIPLCAVLSMGAIAAAPAMAQNFMLRFNHVLAPTEPYHAGFQEWAKRVEERTKGGLKMQVFHSAQLGVEEDIIEQMRQGANIGQNTDSARLGNYVKSMAVMNGPYFVQTLDEVAKLSKAPSVVKWQQELADKHELKVVCFDWVQGFRNFFANKPIKSPADLAGMRIRTPPAPIWQESIRALGASPVAMPFGDMYPGLQQRAIDGIEVSWSNIPGGRFYEVLKYGSASGHILLINFQVVGSKFFNSLPAEYQTALVEECQKAGRATSEKIMASETGTKQLLKEKGMTIVEDIDVAAFRKAGEKAYEVLGIADAKKQVWQEIGKN